MKEWLPVPGSSKAKLVELALDAFRDRGYEGVNVVDLASDAGLTTGSLYHHFGSKLGLYSVIRAEIERRVLDRMEGAAAATSSAGDGAALLAALLVGFDAVVRQRGARLLSEPDPRGAGDAIVELLDTLVARETARMLAAAWRDALRQVADDARCAARVRGALEALLAPRAPARAGSR